MKKHDLKYAAFRLKAVKDAVFPPPSSLSMRLMSYFCRAVIGLFLVLALLLSIEHAMAADWSAFFEKVFIALFLIFAFKFLRATEKAMSDDEKSSTRE